jgi:hypothetical protein
VLEHLLLRMPPQPLGGAGAGAGIGLVATFFLSLFLSVAGDVQSFWFGFHFA